LGAQFFEEPGDEAIFLRGQGMEEVFDLHGLMALLGRIGLGRGDCLLGVFRELV
jgi:hypothetical protein